MRLQFDLQDWQVEELDKLVEEARLANRKDLLNNAVTLFKWAIRERKRGRVIASVDEGSEKYTELQMPVLTSIEKRNGPFEAVEG